MYTPNTADAWKQAIKGELLKHCHHIGGLPVSVDITFLFERPKSHYGSRNKKPYLKDSAPEYHTQKPDIDNLEKAVFDAISDAGMWKDDCQVVISTSAKRWTRRKGGAFITICSPIKNN
jgi:Holliday junction resolvase RusA-like endonuclease